MNMIGNHRNFMAFEKRYILNIWYILSLKISTLKHKFRKKITCSNEYKNPLCLTLMSHCYFHNTDIWWQSPGSSRQGLDLVIRSGREYSERRVLGLVFEAAEQKASWSIWRASQKKVVKYLLETFNPKWITIILKFKTILKPWKCKNEIYHNDWLIGLRFNVHSNTLSYKAGYICMTKRGHPDQHDCLV